VGLILEPIPVPKKKPTSVPEIVAPRRIGRLMRFMQSLPPISRLQRLTNAVYDPAAAFIVEHDLATCNAMFWSCIVYFGMVVAHAVGYPIPLVLIMSLGLVAMWFFIMYCILSIELRRPLVCMPVKVNDLNAALPMIRNSTGMSLKYQLDAYIEKACTHHQLNNGMQEEFYISTLLHKAWVNSAIGLTMTQRSFDTLVNGISPLEFFLQRAKAERIRWRKAQALEVRNTCNALPSRGDRGD
jgi:hypothetical protein